MTTSKGLGISIKYGDHLRKMELRVNQHALGVRVPQGDNLRPALLRKLPSYFRNAPHPQTTSPKGSHYEVFFTSKLCPKAWTMSLDRLPFSSFWKVKVMSF